MQKITPVDIIHIVGFPKDVFTHEFLILITVVCKPEWIDNGTHKEHIFNISSIMEVVTDKEHLDTLSQVKTWCEHYKTVYFKIDEI